jgi:hypothetical protein
VCVFSAVDVFGLDDIARGVDHSLGSHASHVPGSRSSNHSAAGTAGAVP